MNVLVTGGAGYIGSHTCLELLGWKAEKTLADMCRDAWNWQKNNPTGYEG